MTNRFDFAQGQLGRELLARSDELEIKMFRCQGKICATYKLHGSVGSDPFEDNEDEGGLLAKPRDSADDIRFIADLMAQFERALNP